jgi:hypothetical protein
MEAKLQITVNEYEDVTIDSDDFWYIDKHNIQSNMLNNDKLKELLPKIEKLFKDNKDILLEARRNCNDYRLQDISITSFQARILKRISCKGKVTMKLIVEDNDIDTVQFAVETLWRNGLIDRNTYNGQVLYNVNELGERLLEVRYNEKV